MPDKFILKIIQFETLFWGNYLKEMSIKVSKLLENICEGVAFYILQPPSLVKMNSSIDVFHRYWERVILLLLRMYIFKITFFLGHLELIFSYIRSSHSELFLGKGVLKISNKFTGEHPCRSAISIKLQSNFIEIALRHGCSPENLLHIFKHLFLRTPLDGPICCLKFQRMNTHEWIKLLINQMKTQIIYWGLCCIEYNKEKLFESENTKYGASWKAHANR